MSYWCDRGVDAWRLDAAYAVAPTFWQAVLPRVRERTPDVWVFGEMIHGDYAGLRSGIRPGRGDPVRAVEAIWSSLNDRNLFELAHALGRHADLLATFLPQTFVGNHDTTRLTSQLTDPRHAALALAVLFTRARCPDRLLRRRTGLGGVKEDRAGGDDAIRPAYPPDPSGSSAPAADLRPAPAPDRRAPPQRLDQRRHRDRTRRPAQRGHRVPRSPTRHTTLPSCSTRATLTAELRLPLADGHVAAGDGTAACRRRRWSRRDGGAAQLPHHHADPRSTPPPSSLGRVGHVGRPAAGAVRGPAAHDSDHLLDQIGVRASLAQASPTVEVGASSTVR
jgi:hypothetical protein